MEIDATRRIDGAYASVFINDSEKLAWKVFKRKHDASEEHVRDVFASELEALTLAQNNELLGSIVPNSPTEVEVSAIRLNGSVITVCDYYPSACIQMSALPGDFGITKFGHKNDGNAEEIKVELRKLGINHFVDASYTADEDGNVTGLVDFATTEHELQWESS